jgi:hypothetical protein
MPRSSRRRLSIPRVIASMDDAAIFASLAGGGVSVAAMPHLHVASLRYFERDGHFGVLVRQITGLDLPDLLRASFAMGEQGELSVLVWRGPTETLLLSDNPSVFSAVARRLTSATDGCMVVQTGGLIVLAVQGGRTAELLRKLGSPASIPAVGEARTSRLAELPILSLSLHEGTVWLIAERVHLAHLRGWIEQTLADLS